MDNADFLLEAAKNSIEAGCSALTLELDYTGSEVKLTARDDGRGPMIEDVFGLGRSERGPNRGLGLYMLKNASSGRCGLRRENGSTVLEAFLKPDESLMHLEDTLPALFNMKTAMTFIKKVNGEEVWRMEDADLTEEDIDPSCAKGIAAVRNLVRLNEERSRKKNG